LQFFANQPILNSGQSHRILRREVATAGARQGRRFTNSPSTRCYVVELHHGARTHLSSRAGNVARGAFFDRDQVKRSANMVSWLSEERASSCNVFSEVQAAFFAANARRTVAQIYDNLAQAELCAHAIREIMGDDRRKPIRGSRDLRALRKTWH
jgi:hypothetical protein